MRTAIPALASVLSCAALLSCAARPAFAQLVSHPDAPIRIGHYHLNVTSVEAHKKFWADTLGGKAMKFGSIDVIEFPDAFIFLHVQKPTGPTRGTAFDHIGFAVPDVPAMATRLAAAGYKETTGREPKPGEASAAASGTSAVYGRFAYFIGPDGAKIELVTSDRKTDAPPIVAHHIHFINKQYVEMQQWYMKAFDATLRPGQTDFFIGADLPGVGYSLNFFRWEGDQSITHVPTAGRVVDHVGFEVKNLNAFCKALEAKGIKLVRPYRKRDPAMNNIATAMIVDPWGVSIELTEGLDKIN
ncbi:MAG TPA: VOC family protein [Bryobacteraceae bacterium]|jgi:catechol 2,3-dioxygenase-like lactoylglutathione lyase family enzyme|nr:VOC family protein [Bryobacteraceae bacterium]